MAATKKSASKKPAKKDLTVEFEFERDTKNKRRFAEVEVEGQEPVIGTLYVSKSAFNGTLPESLTVTIS